MINFSGGLGAGKYGNKRDHVGMIEWKERVLERTGGNSHLGSGIET